VLWLELNNPAESILTLIPALEKLQTSPRDIAIVDGESTMCWSELFGGALEIADFLESSGLVPGDHIAVLAANRKEYYQVYLGAVVAGVWLTPVNSHLTTREIDYVLSDSGSKVVFTDDSDLLANCEFAIALPLHRQDKPASLASEATYHRLKEKMSGLPGGFLMYTSGTTGQPKGVKRSSPPTLFGALSLWCQTGAAVGLDGRGAHLVTGPIYHAAPGMYSFYDLLNGAQLVLMQRWDAQRCLELIQAHSIVRTHLVPTMFVRLLRERQNLPDDYDLGSLRMVLHGAAPVAAQVKREMIAWWGEVLVEYWGGSESGVITSVDSAQWLEHPGTVGRPLPQFELSVRDESFGELNVGEVGSLYARKPGLPRPFHYFNDRAKTEASYTDDWFTLGDLGWRDEHGYVYIADRRSNLIISGGVNIYPAEVEGVFLEHPSVVDVAVIGLDDEEWGKRVHAVVQCVAGYPAAAEMERDLLAFAATRLAGFKIPRSVEIVESLPRYDSGKLYLNRLDPSAHDR